MKPEPIYHTMHTIRRNVLAIRGTTWWHCPECKVNMARAAGICVDCVIAESKGRPAAVWNRYVRWLNHWAGKRGDE